jgi:hypothetical protein
MFNGPMESPRLALNAETAMMVADGVESERLPMQWALVQPYLDAASVPVGQRDRYPLVDGVPSDFSQLDRRVLVAAAHHLSILALVLQAPGWAALDPRQAFSPPRAPALYTRFLTTLEHRYGPGGTLWADHPEVTPGPVRAWQIWNEPNLRLYWSVQPFAPSYVALERAAYRTLHRLDPRVRVVQAGLANYSWQALKALYRAGARPYFDVGAVHPFSGYPVNSLKIALINRRVMDRAGDRRKPIWLTEMTWSSAHGRIHHATNFEVTERQQGPRLAQAYALYAAAARRLRLQRIYWYTWASVDRASENTFDYSGLRRPARRGGGLVDKPAMAFFRATARRLEGCRKSRRADVCAVSLRSKVAKSARVAW